MTDHLFILGSNWLLSIAELIVYLRNRNIRVGVKDFSKRAVILSSAGDFNDEQLTNIQSALGGCYKVAKVVTSYDCETAKRAFPVTGRIIQKERATLLSCPWVKEVWAQPKDQRIKFGVSTYPMWNDQSVDLKRFTVGMDEAVKAILIKMGAKNVAYYVYEGPDRRKSDRQNTALWPQTLIRHGLLASPNAEILAVFTAKTLYIGRTVAAYDSILQQHRDEARPYISPEISTSPKICRTLLNVAGAKPGDTVLDPFCGTGTLLMEAAVLGMSSIGIDIDDNAVKGTIANLRWLEKELGRTLKFSVFRGDARKTDSLVKERVDVVAFEPELGPIHSTRPEEDEAGKTIEGLTSLYHDTLTAASRRLKPEGRVAMTLPVINSKQGLFRVDLNELVRGTPFTFMPFLPKECVIDVEKRGEEPRLKTERTSLPERKRGQIVQRELVMLSR
jgi:tRNA G10  N-methylase Trm11